MDGAADPEPDPTGDPDRGGAGRPLSGGANSDEPRALLGRLAAGDGLLAGPGALGNSDAPVVDRGGLEAALATGDPGATLATGGPAAAFPGMEPGAAFAAGDPAAPRAGGAPGPALAGIEPAAALAGGAPGPALAGIEPAAALAGGAPGPALAGIEPLAALAGGASGPALAGIEPAAALAGGASGPALAGIEPAAALAPGDPGGAFVAGDPGAALAAGDPGAGLAGALAGAALTGPGPLAGAALPAAGALAGAALAGPPLAGGAALADPAALPAALAGAALAGAFACPLATPLSGGRAGALAAPGRPRAASTRLRLVSRAARTSSASANSRRKTRLKRFSTSRSTRRTSATGAPGAEGHKTTVGSIRATVRASWEAPLLVRLQPLAWASLVITAGPAAAAALDSWSTAPRTAASLILWVVWGAVLLASFAPRPLGLTALRVAAPVAVALALAAAPAAGSLKGLLALAGTAVAAWLALTPAVGYRFVNGAAYGEERRYPLRVPPALLLGPVPLAGALMAAGGLAGPLLLADQRYVAGVVALVAAVPVVRATGRSVYALSQRWAVLVPAGIVLKDPLTLVDPVLFPRDRIASLRPLPYPNAPADDILDLRLGAAPGSLLLELTDDAQLFRAHGRLRGGEAVKARRLAFSPRQPEALLAEAATRKKPRGSVL